MVSIGANCWRDSLSWPDDNIWLNSLHSTCFEYPSSHKGYLCFSCSGFQVFNWKICIMEQLISMKNMLQWFNSTGHLLPNKRALVLWCWAFGGVFYSNCTWIHKPFSSWQLWQWRHCYICLNVYLLLVGQVSEDRISLLGNLDCLVIFLHGKPYFLNSQLSRKQSFYDSMFSMLGFSVGWICVHY